MRNLVTIKPARYGHSSLTISIALTLLCHCASATTYYVATNGSDASSSGTITSPFLTLQKGVNAAVAGDTIIVRDGTYGANGVGPTGFPVYINSAGTSSAPITLKAEHKWSASLNCQLNCHSYINLLDGAAYWIIQDFDITQGYWAGVWGNSAANHYTLRGNHIHNIGNRFDSSDLGIEGFYSDVPSHDITFDGNMFNDIGRTGGLPYPNHDHGIYSHGTNGTVINNIFYNMTKGWSIQLVDNATNWLIANNTFAFPNPGRDGQIILYGGNNGGTATVSKTTIRNNIFYQPSNYAIVTNNSVPLNGCTIDHNIVYGATAVIDEPAWCSMSSNQVGSNPMLVNTSTAPYDFHLQSSSPAIDAGVAVSAITVDFDGNARPQGAAMDFGACEYMSATNGPVISGVFTSGVLPNSAFINWSTNVGATSYVQYGLTSSYSYTTPTNTTLITTHSVALSGLTSSTTYHYRVASADSGGHLSVSGDFTFTTPSSSSSSFTLSAASSTTSVAPGAQANDVITATMTSGSAVPVTFSTSSLPAGVTASFSANCTATCSTTLTLKASTTAVSGNYSVVVTGTGSGTSASTTIALSVGMVVTAQDYTSGMAAWWKFDEGSGTTANDSSGNGNSATLVAPKQRNNSSWVTGTYGTAISLNGTSGKYLSVNESSALEMTGQMTVSFWLRPNTQSATDPQPRVVSKVNDWEVKLNGASRYPQFAAAGKYARIGYSLPASTWQHVVFTFSSGNVSAYVNGVLVSLAENTFTGTESLPVQASGLLIGTDSGQANPYAGLLDDVRIYNRVLNNASVSALYSATLH